MRYREVRSVGKVNLVHRGRVIRSIDAVMLWLVVRRQMVIVGRAV